MIVKANSGQIEIKKLSISELLAQLTDLYDEHLAGYDIAVPRVTVMTEGRSYKGRVLSFSGEGTLIMDNPEMNTDNPLLSYINSALISALEIEFTQDLAEFINRDIQIAELASTQLEFKKKINTLQTKLAEKLGSGPQFTIADEVLFESGNVRFTNIIMDDVLKVLLDLFLDDLVVSAFREEVDGIIVTADSVPEVKLEDKKLVFIIDPSNPTSGRLRKQKMRDKIESLL